jgi:acylphosphatase
VVQYEIRISGKVQGVGFRYFTQKQGKILNLTGWVRNTLDENVMAVVQGSKHAVDTFIDHMWIGPPMSDVQSVTKTETTVLEEYSDFEIRH